VTATENAMRYTVRQAAIRDRLQDDNTVLENVLLEVHQRLADTEHAELVRAVASDLGFQFSPENAGL
jgi:hypothetical protein